MLGLEKLFGGSRGEQQVDGEQPQPIGIMPPAQAAAWKLTIPAGARSERGLTLKDAIGHACFAIAMSSEAVITPGAQAGTFDLHTSSKGAFDTKGFGQTLRLDADYWSATVSLALREGKTVWTTDYSYNDYDIKTLAPSRA